MHYYEEVKWCDRCGRYVRYLLSLKGSYCIHCGAQVRLFNKHDLKKFKETLETNKVGHREAGKG